MFQSSLAMLPSLKVEVLRLLCVLLGKFIATGSVPTTHIGINEINLSDPAIQLVDSELGIGHEAWSYLKKKTFLILEHYLSYLMVLESIIMQARRKQF